jgi:hypothetical protein
VSSAKMIMLSSSFHGDTNYYYPPPNRNTKSRLFSTATPIQNKKLKETLVEETKRNVIMNLCISLSQ